MVKIKIPGSFHQHPYVIFAGYDPGGVPEAVKVYYKGMLDNEQQCLLRETSRSIFLMEWNATYQRNGLQDIPVILVQKEKLPTDPK